MLVYYPIFSRDEAINSEFIGESQFRGFGRQSGKSYTIPQAKGSTSHHRIIYYQLGSLNFLVRHEVDGYVKDDGDQQNFITSAWELLNLSQSKPLKEKRFSSSRLRIQHFGEPVTRESTLEIKTRAAKKPLDLEKVIPQLWISQTPKLFVHTTTEENLHPPRSKMSPFRFKTGSGVIKVKLTFLST